MNFITPNRKLHLFDNFWTFRKQNTEYNYIYVENYIYVKNSNRLWKYIKTEQRPQRFSENI